MPHYLSSVQFRVWFWLLVLLDYSIDHLLRDVMLKLAEFTTDLLSPSGREEAASTTKKPPYGDVKLGKFTAGVLSRLVIVASRLLLPEVPGVASKQVLLLDVNQVVQTELVLYLGDLDLATSYALVYGIEHRPLSRVHA